MARTYAAVMALLAMLVVLIRAMKNHAGFEGTISNALLWMILFGMVGLVVGMIAQATVDQSVLKIVDDELAIAEANQQAEESPAAT